MTPDAQVYRKYWEIAVSDLHKVNLTSVSLVKDELAATIDRAAGLLDQYAADLNDSESLADLAGNLRQVHGVFQVIQLRGGELLAVEMMTLLESLGGMVEARKLEALGALGTAAFVLSRYLDFVLANGVARPELLIPYVNLLRSQRSQAPVPEAHFFSCRLNAVFPGTKPAGFAQDLGALVKRYRHMYQVGLLALMKNKPVAPALGMMARALQRVASLASGRQSASFWTVAGVSLQALSVHSAQLGKSRLLVFGMIDRQLKIVQKEGYTALESEPPKVLLRECLYWLALVEPMGQAGRILQAFDVEPLPYSEKDLETERASLGGPGATAIAAVAEGLMEEVTAVRRMLDDADDSEAGYFGSDDGLASALMRIANTLVLLNFTKAGEGLKDAVGLYQHAPSGDEDALRDVLHKVANQVLVAESAIKAMRRGNVVANDDNGVCVEELVANSQLAEAEAAVFSEAEAGLSLIKRALASYAESDYDHGHIRNVSKTLTALRGGLQVLNLQRAAVVVDGLKAFVDRISDQKERPVAIEHSLDIFADAIISLEYYLGEAKHHRAADLDSLSLAVESLEALGYPVATA